MHWDGSTVETINLPVAGRVTGLFAPAADDLWIATSSRTAGALVGHVFHWDGTEYTDVSPRYPLSTPSLWGVPGKGVWVAGSHGAVLHHR